MKTKLAMISMLALFTSYSAFAVDYKQLAGNYSLQIANVDTNTFHEEISISDSGKVSLSLGSFDLSMGCSADTSTLVDNVLSATLDCSYGSPYLLAIDFSKSDLKAKSFTAVVVSSSIEKPVLTNFVRQ